MEPTAVEFAEKLARILNDPHVQRQVGITGNPAQLNGDERNTVAVEYQGTSLFLQVEEA